MNEAQKLVPRLTLYQAAKLALMKGSKCARFPAFLIPSQDEAAVAARILEMAPTLPSVLKAAGHLTIKDVNKTCVWLLRPFLRQS